MFEGQLNLTLIGVTFRGRMVMHTQETWSDNPVQSSPPDSIENPPQAHHSGFQKAIFEHI
jgi:hypothetical protein